MKRFTHIIRMAAFSTAVTLAREIRTNTGFQRADREAPHNLVRQVLKQPGDIDPTQHGILTITLDPMPSAKPLPSQSSARASQRPKPAIREPT